MSFDNSVRDARGQVAGFRCRRCDEVKSQLWGDICNKCRDEAAIVGALDAKLLATVVALTAERDKLLARVKELEGNSDAVPKDWDSFFAKNGAE